MIANDESKMRQRRRTSSRNLKRIVSVANATRQGDGLLCVSPEGSAGWDDKPPFQRRKPRFSYPLAVRPLRRSRYGRCGYEKSGISVMSLYGKVPTTSARKNSQMQSVE